VPPAAHPAAHPAAAPAPRASLPPDFVFETEHPVLPVPFSATMGEARLTGTGLSATAAYVAIEGSLDERWINHRAPVRLAFDFEGFAITIPADMRIAGSRKAGEMTLQFTDPLGPHLPQLRHILNSHIAGDLVTMGGFLAYTGPTKPKAARAAETGGMARRLRSLTLAATSLTVIVVAAGMMLNRATQTYEVRPVFVEREGRDMRATTAGQVSFLNTEARKGEVVFSINANTGDVLNFQLPCECRVQVTDGMFEGATVLPDDVILSTFESNLGVRVETQISIEGLAKVTKGDRAYLDMADGRTLPVAVKITSATNAAVSRGDPFVPVTLAVPEGALTDADIGKAGRLRLSSFWLTDLLSNRGGTT
jgi:hypothetical protein